MGLGKIVGWGGCLLVTELDWLLLDRNDKTRQMGVKRCGVVAACAEETAPVSFDGVSPTAAVVDARRGDRVGPLFGGKAAERADTDRLRCIPDSIFSVGKGRGSLEGEVLEGESDNGWICGSL